MSDEWAMFVTPDTKITKGEWIFITFWTIARVIFGGVLGVVAYHFITKYW